MAILRAVLLMLLGIGLTVSLQVVVRRRWPAERRARGWNGATWGAAVYAFGPLSMLGFFWVVRGPGAKGVITALGLGLGAAALLLAGLSGFDLVLDALLSAAPSTR